MNIIIVNFFDNSVFTAIKNRTAHSCLPSTIFDIFFVKLPFCVKSNFFKDTK